MMSDKQASILSDAMMLYDSTFNLTAKGVANMYRLVISELITKEEIRALRYAILTLFLFDNGAMKQSALMERRFNNALERI